MNNYDLRKIHELISFRDLFASDHEYMSELNRLPRIELETEPLYNITQDTSLLFTPKLRYYQVYINREINKHINAVIALLETDKTGELTKYILKKTREAVTTLINDLNRDLAFCESVWPKITSANPTISDSDRPQTENAIFIHYTIAELSRCWMEIQDRYAYIIGEAACYDVSLFYTTIVRRMPDDVFKLERSEKYEEEAKGLKNVRTDCCFHYDNDEYFAIAIQEFTNKLKQYNLIPAEIDYKDMESLFSGRSCRKKYMWLGEKHILTHIVKGLTKENEQRKAVITTWPIYMSKWDIVSYRFVDKEGNSLPNIRTEKLRKKQETLIREIIESLATYR